MPLGSDLICPQAMGKLYSTFRIWYFLSICLPVTIGNSLAVSHLYNGTILDIAKVPATSDYRRLIERLGNAPVPKSGHFERWQRWWNKKRGLPATTNVGALASLLVALKLATVEALSQPIDRVAVTRPSIPALTREDLDDALEYAGLRGWVGDSRGYQPHHVVESQAAFAGNGYGLCISYQDVLKCWHEGNSWPHRVALFVSFTRHALYVSLDKMQMAFPRWVRDGPRALHFNGGLDSRSEFASETDYWDHVRSSIAAISQQSSRPLDVLLLGGENATDGTFLATLRDALGPTMPLSFDVAAVADPTFAAARGMAIYARRRQEAPGHCVETRRCELERERQRARGDEGRTEL